MAISIILPIIIILVVAWLAFMVTAGSKIKNEEEGKIMVKNIFIYLVLFCTLMMTIGGSVGAFMAAADIIAPVPYHQSFEDYKRYNAKVNMDNPEAGERPDNISEEELRKEYEALVISENNRQIARAKNSLIKSLGWIIIPLPVFVIFQKKLSSQAQ